MQLTWTEERRELVTKLWQEGLSASQIAGRVGKVSRNAVIGIIHRMGLSGRATTQRSPHKRRQRKINPVATVRATIRPHQSLRAVILPPVGEIPVNVIRKAHPDYLKSDHCRYHYGDVGNGSGGFCAEPSATGVAYCSGHAQIVFAPQAPRRQNNWKDTRPATSRNVIMDKGRVLA
jgi:GcrA cell cycle regulator